MCVPLDRHGRRHNIVYEGRAACSLRTQPSAKTRNALRPGMFRIFFWQARVCRTLAFCSIESVAEACTRTW